jgi:membrane fusion protein (multidrug efflux system)
MLKHSVLVLLLILAGCGKKDPAPTSAAASEAPAVRLSVLKVQPQPFTASIAVTGSLVSLARVEVKAETTGRIVKFPKEEGDRVEAGEAVIWVDDTDHKLLLAQADSAAKVAEAALERARVMEAHSIAELERAENLVKSGGITDKDLKTARVTAQDSKAQVALAAAQLEQARVGVRTAQKRVADTAVQAPVSGEIQRKSVNVGAYIEPPTAVFTLVDNRRLELESQVAAAELAPIRPGQRVTFTVTSFPDKTFEGQVTEILPAVDAESRSAKVRVKVDNRSGLLKAGMFAQGEILTGVAAHAVVVPTAAVYRDDRSAREAVVFVLENGKAARRTVRIGREKDHSVEIVSGLKAGDVLVAQQSIELAEGVRIEPVEGNGNSR